VILEDEGTAILRNVDSHSPNDLNSTKTLWHTHI